MDIINHPVFKSFLAGSFSGTFSTILFQPLDLVKTRLQDRSQAALINAGGRGHGSGMVDVFSTIWQREHARGLWRGVSASLARCVPGVGLYFSTLDYLKAEFCQGKQPGPLQAVAIGVAARAASGVLLIPVTVVKTRVESGAYPYKSVAHALASVYRSEGARGLCSGLVPTLFRDAPFSGIYLMFYTQARSLTPHSPEWHFTCGVVAGGLASAVTQPADVLKTAMQLHPGRYSGVWSAAVDVYMTHGPAGFFRGLVPRALRRTLMAAMAWTVYEHLIVQMGLK